jgi:NAD-dependent DNA ligase
MRSGSSRGPSGFDVGRLTHISVIARRQPINVQHDVVGRLPLASDDVVRRFDAAIASWRDENGN